jgi:hypothetical protein
MNWRMRCRLFFLLSLLVISIRDVLDSHLFCSWTPWLPSLTIDAVCSVHLRVRLWASRFRDDIRWYLTAAVSISCPVPVDKADDGDISPGRLECWSRSRSRLPWGHPTDLPPIFTWISVGWDCCHCRQTRESNPLLIFMFRSIIVMSPSLSENKIFTSNWQKPETNLTDWASPENTI